MEMAVNSQFMAAAETVSPLFYKTLVEHDLKLERSETTTLQVNVGLLCNQTCRHCHLDAGPGRQEIMGHETADAVIDYAARGDFEAVDITGGAPELNPNILRLIEGLSRHSSRIIFRSNLSLLSDGKRAELIDVLKEKKIVIVASFPSFNEIQADSQRGEGIFQKSIDALSKLNTLGYGDSETGLELNLVSNPAGAFLPGAQGPLEKRFREVLQNKWGLQFNHLYAFANVPLGRFRAWLKEKGNLDAYLERLASNFNVCAVEGVMCRSLISVSWDGFLYDCDFNLAKGLPMGKQKTHVSEMAGPPDVGSPIACADHCYTCTAGTGFT
ncbi:MAG TPA: arsenosugar biosynthesis radical SAM (seleno)protein ArsS [Desulfobacteria bacterium]|nr:arsenosugar biosynthesis radical SAM (seleno)protein ArsS [Desulfobacteria bacterium]